MLNTVMRAKVPENALAQCKPADRTVVENILVVTQETIPTIDITRCVLTNEGGIYHVSVPSVHPEDKVSLRELMNIQAYNAARIQDIHVRYKNDALNLHILIYDETTPIVTSQIDIMRICKKSKRVI